MKSPDTLLRSAEHAEIAKIALFGKVIDLGGDRKSEYQKLFKGKFDITILNTDLSCKPDIIHDLEKPFLIDDDSYDGVLLINVLEHIYNYKALLNESSRILKKRGIIVVVVPFLFPYHPSPHDFHRYTKDTLSMEMKELGLQEIRVDPLGYGVFSACFLFVDRLMPLPIRYIFHFFNPLVICIDRLFARLSNVLGKKYKTSDYALGYVVVAKK